MIALRYDVTAGGRWLVLTTDVWTTPTDVRTPDVLVTCQQPMSCRFSRKSAGSFSLSK